MQVRPNWRQFACAVWSLNCLVQFESEGVHGPQAPPGERCKTTQPTLVLASSSLLMSPVTRRAATWPLVLELKFFLSNNVRMSKATEMCLRDHNSNNCTHSGNVCYCTYMINNDYDTFRSFSRLYMTISASNLHIIFAWKSRQIFSLSPMARWQHSLTALIFS